MLDDPITLNRIAGTALVIAGIALVNSGTAVRRVLATAVDAGRGPADTAADADAR